MTTPFLYHTQQAQRRNNEARESKQIKSIYKTAENYHRARNSDQYLAESIKVSASQTAYARDKLSQNQKENLESTNDFKSSVLNIFTSNSKLGFADLDATVNSYPYLHCYKRARVHQSFANLSSKLSDKDLRSLLVSYRAREFRKFINYRIALVESLIIKHSPFSPKKVDIVKEIYTRAIQPMFAALHQGYVDFNLSNIPSENPNDWLPKNGIFDAGDIVHQCFNNLHNISKDNFMSYWLGYGDVIFSLDFSHYAQEHYQSINNLSSCILDLKKSIQSTHTQITSLIDPKTFATISVFDDENNDEKITRGSTYAKGY